MNQYLSLFRCWLTQDRIRVPPETGRLLTLVVKDRLVVAGTVYQVTDRQVIRTGGEEDDAPGMIRVNYRLETEDGEACLRVVSNLDSGEVRSELSHGQRSFAIFEDDVSPG